MTQGVGESVMGLWNSSNDEHFSKYEATNLCGEITLYMCLGSFKDKK